MKTVRTVLVLSVALVFTFLTADLQAQYFGRNKVQWENFKFRTLRTEHFDIYYYADEEPVVHDVGRMAERWYTRLSTVFNHSFKHKPIVLYANQADFQQTTTTGGQVGEGTGGFTDAFQNRVVLPLTASYAETDHVLGHELVHVFQFDIAANRRQGHNQGQQRGVGLEELPLWMVEGLAEYLSQGRDDPQTAMWLRDAVINDKLPGLKKLNRDPRLSPYQFGQALWAYIGGKYGDDMAVRLFLNAGVNGLDDAFRRTLGIPSEQLFREWHAAASQLYQPVLAARWNGAQMGSPILGRDNTGADLNIAPVVSPDGRTVAFLSTRNLFSVGLYLADAQTGRVIAKLTAADANPHIDALRFIDSSGTWSPDGRKFAFIVTERGDNRLAIVDVDSRSIEQRISVPDAKSMTDPAWSPDGRSIAFSGESGGVTDIYIYDLQAKTTRRLMNDHFGDFQPAWSPDGRTIAFASDRGPATDLGALSYGPVGISTIDVASGKISRLPLFNDAKDINPQYSPDGGSLYFIGNPGGVSDVFRYSFSSGAIQRLTKVSTGVTGITELSPALSVSKDTGRLMFSVFQQGRWNIYGVASGTSGETELALNGPAGAGGVLPPFPATTRAWTSTYLATPSEGLLPPTATFDSRAYDRRLHLAYAGPAVFGGVSLGGGQSQFGVGGDISLLFTDILGREEVGVTIQGGGSSGAGGSQIGGEAYYLNQENRLHWGGGVTHIPYVTGFGTSVSDEPIDIGNGQVVQGTVYQQRLDTVTLDQISGITQYPLSSTRRFELNAGYQRYAFSSQVEQIITVGNSIIDDQLFHLDAQPDINLLRTSVAFVGDNSYFGFVSPIEGVRYRYEAEGLTGDLKYETGLADYRRYFFARPVTLAVRGLFYGRFGTDAEDPRLGPLFLGYPDLVRGYESGSFNGSECTQVPGDNGCPEFDRLVGSKIAVASAELRIPLLGTREFGLISAPWIPTELAPFVDVGAAWTKAQSAKFKYETNTIERVPVVSAGVTLRLVLGGYLPLEFYYAKPFQRPQENGVWGFTISPGW